MKKKFLLSLIISLVVFSFFFIDKTEADPNWLSGWDYRKAINIDNTGNSNNLTNYQVLITNLDTDFLISQGKMQSNCEDIRFTDSDEITVINYWIESGCGTANTTIWVKVPSIPASSQKTIYMYYGNSGAGAVSNQSEVCPGGSPDDYCYELYDNFANLDNWTTGGDGGIARIVSGYAEISSNINRGDGWIRTNSKYPVINRKIEARASFHTAEGPAHAYFVPALIGGGGTIRHDWGWDNNYHSHALYTSNGWTYGTKYPSDETWRETYLLYLPDYAEGKYKGETVVDTSFTALSDSYIYFGIYDLRGENYVDSLRVDWVRMRHYASPEPTTSVYAELTFTSVSDGAPYLDAGEVKIDFTPQGASDPDGDPVKLYVCKTSDCVDCGPGGTEFTNKSFETGDFTGWTQDHTGTYETAVSNEPWSLKDGTYFVEWYTTGATADGSYGQITQIIDLTNINTIRFQLKGDEYAHRVRFSVYVNTTEVWYRNDLVTGTDYPDQEVDVSGYTGIHSITFRNTKESGDWGGDTFIDNIIILDGGGEVITGCWAFSDSGVAEDPSATYNCFPCAQEAGTSPKDYWAKVCDDKDACSGIITGGSFTCKKEDGCPCGFGFNYQKQMTINNSTADDLYDYQMKLIVHKGSGSDSGNNVYLNNHALNWPNDIYFTKLDNSPLSYWVEFSDSNTATIWIKFDYIPASGSADFYMYYGNSEVGPGSDGENTFIFFDDFSGTSVDISKWAVVETGAGSVTVSGGVAYLNIPAGTDDARILAKQNGGYLQTYGIQEFRAKHQTGSSGCGSWGIAFTGGWLYGSPSNNMLYLYSATYGSQKIIDYDTNYHTYKFVATGAHAIVYADGAQKIDNPQDWKLYPAFGTTEDNRQGDTWVDYIFVRKYTSTEPSWGIWGAEVPGYFLGLDGEDSSCFGGYCCGGSCQSNPCVPEVTYSRTATAIYEVLNNPPEVITLPPDSTGRCFTGYASVYLSWQFNDIDSGDTQSAYQVEIFSDPGYTNLVNRSCDSSLTNPSARCETPSLTYSPNNLSFGTIYYWRVRVWDDQGVVSNYTDGESFDTELKYPWPDFDLTPETPSVGGAVQFCSVYEEDICLEDKSACYDVNTNPISCSGGTFTWTIPGDYEFLDGTNSNSENPRVKFLTIVEGVVTLEVTDTYNHGPCSETHPIKVTLPLPEWKEIAPY